MDRFAVFIDAGYVLAVGARIVWGRKVPRSAATVQHRAFLEHLINYAAQDCKLEPLRVYWYDGATDQVPTSEHQTLGELTNVKVRLGRLVQSQQKGVDTLIVLDLTTLARERAIATAYVMSGDEDLREGVASAQQLGVRVVLWGLEPIPQDEPNQAMTLVREADEHRILASDEFIRPFFSAAALQASLASVDQSQAEGAAPAAGSPTPRQVGRNFSAEWLASSPPAAAVESLRQAKAQFPHIIPAALDAELLAKGRNLVANPLTEAQKRDLRKGFWEGVS